LGSHWQLQVSVRVSAPCLRKQHHSTGALRSGFSSKNARHPSINPFFCTDVLSTVPDEIVTTASIKVSALRAYRWSPTKSMTNLRLSGSIAPPTPPRPTRVTCRSHETNRDEYNNAHGVLYRSLLLGVACENRKLIKIHPPDTWRWDELNLVLACAQLPDEQLRRRDKVIWIWRWIIGCETRSKRSSWTPCIKCSQLPRRSAQLINSECQLTPDRYE
jgi:hypothetical protein